jgi:hypothetical protein
MELPVVVKDCNVTGLTGRSATRAEKEWRQLDHYLIPSFLRIVILSEARPSRSEGLA